MSAVSRGPAIHFRGFFGMDPIGDWGRRLEARLSERGYTFWDGKVSLDGTSTRHGPWGTVVDEARQAADHLRTGYPYLWLRLYGYARKNEPAVGRLEASPRLGVRCDPFEGCQRAIDTLWNSYLSLCAVRIIETPHPESEQPEYREFLALLVLSVFLLRFADSRNLPCERCGLWRVDPQTGEHFARRLARRKQKVLLVLERDEEVVLDRMSPLCSKCALDLKADGWEVSYASFMGHPADPHAL